SLLSFSPLPLGEGPGVRADRHRPRSQALTPTPLPMGEGGISIFTQDRIPFHLPPTGASAPSAENACQVIHTCSAAGISCSNLPCLPNAEFLRAAAETRCRELDPCPHRKDRAQCLPSRPSSLPQALAKTIVLGFPPYSLRAL